MKGLFLLCVVAFSVLGESLQCAHLQIFSGLQGNFGDIQYNLYTRSNPTWEQRLIMNDIYSITSSNFNAMNPVVVIVHGWCDNKDSSFNRVVRDAFLQKSDVNVIVLDWSHMAAVLYVYAVNNVPSVGRNLGQFLDFASQATGVPVTNMHLIGFSLGAHVVGNAGRELGGRVARITGLDPAGPFWYGNPNCLCASDAVYVEAIHTNACLVGLGIKLAVGDADFFVNGGTWQPGCFDKFCNHDRAWELFAATVKYDHLIGQHCANLIELYTDSCRGSYLNMGNDNLNKRGSGLYRLNT